MRAARRRVDALLASGVSFERIEEIINRQRQLTEEQKSALWLYAFARTPRQAQTRLAREAMATLPPREPRWN